MSEIDGVGKRDNFKASLTDDYHNFHVAVIKIIKEIHLPGTPI